jgi:signal transduction histidine kinase
VDEEQHLKEKARMLLQREREYFELLQKQERLSVWLNLSQAFPELFLDPKSTQVQRWDRVRKLLISRLRMQRVLVFEVDGTELRPLSPAGPPLPWPPEARALLETTAFGLCNDPEAEAEQRSRALAQAVGLSRFMWSRIASSNGRQILIAAGFDRAKASFQSLLVDNEASFFRSATQHIESLHANSLFVGELARANEFLEQRVRERTQELAGKNRELRLVLDNVDQALITINLEGRLVLERSSVVDRWFGTHAGQPLFLEYVPADPRFAALFTLGLEALRDDFLPREVCLDQLPKQLVVRDQHFECRYLPIEEGNRLTALLLVIDDVTERRARTRADAEQRELLAAFTALMRDRNGFLSFVEQTQRMLPQLADPSCALSLQMQLWHTFKGNAATLGLHVIADACHAAEDELVEFGQVRPDTLERLSSRWTGVLETVSSVAPTSLHRAIEVSEQQLLAFTEQAQRGASAMQLVDELRRLQWEPIERSLQRLAQQAQALAIRLDKPPLSVEVKADDLRLEPTAWAELWAALVHVVRNAIDHGVERPDERTLSGKPRSGRLRFSAVRAGNGFQLEIDDDGRGIDWENVRRVCEEQQRPSQSQDDLIAALLEPGVSTRKEVTQTSGRGIGLSAVAAVVRSLGGALRLESEHGRGTRLSFSFAEALPQPREPDRPAKLDSAAAPPV